MGGELRADFAAISQYANALARWGLSATMQPLLQVQQLNILANEAFLGISEGGQFAEGVLMKRQVDRTSSQFKALLGDVGIGIQAISNAAQTCTDTYCNTDTESAANIDIVRYAFGSTEVGRPPGLPSDVSGTTLADFRAEAMASGQGALSDALVDPDGGMTYQPYAGMTVTVYPDGSTRTIATTTASNGASSTVTQIIGADGVPVSQTTKTTQLNADGSTTQILSNDTNPEHVVATQTVTAPDGTVTIVTTEDGQQVGPPTVIHPDDPPAARDQPGPVQDALERYGRGTGGVYDYGDGREPGTR